jgi:predicted kinase
MLVTLPDPALVLLVGPSGAGKSTFARLNFAPTQIISSDTLRAMLSDDEADQGASAEAFRILRLLVVGRVSRRLTTVVDATNLRAADRRDFVKLAGRHRLPAVAIAFDLPDERYHAHNSSRADRVVDAHVVENQAARMADVLAALPGEGYEVHYVLGEAELARGTTVERRPVAP